MDFNDLSNELDKKIHSLVHKHLPSKHPFFENLKKSDTSDINSPQRLASLYHHYQAAMHATRVMVYFIPYLNTPVLRQRKLAIFVDDDALFNGDTHHMQLYRAFENLNTNFVYPETIYGDLEALTLTVDPFMQKFIKIVEKLYEKSLGAWCIVEMMSDNWMRAFYDGLAVHFPSISQEPYFCNCFADHVEERHGKEALELTLASIDKNPLRYQQTLKHARYMAKSLDLLWNSLNAQISSRD